MMPLMGTTFVLLGDVWLNPAHVESVKQRRGGVGNPLKVVVTMLSGAVHVIDQDGLRDAEDVIKKLVEE